MVSRFFSRLRVYALALARICPRRLKEAGGALLGGLVGLVGGIPGFLIGLLLGCLLQELFSQTFLNRNILDYLENPGTQRFYEGEPGLAAWCALGILAAAADNDGEALYPGTSPVVRQVMLEAARVFRYPLAEPSLVERFSRLAWSRRESLNSDLLAESFAARRSSEGDAGKLARSLSRLANGEKGRRLVLEISSALPPAFNGGNAAKTSGAENDPRESNPWKILGLVPGTEPGEVKTHYRRLAKQFHPDELQVLDEKQREAAGRAFIAIKDAYRKILDKEV